MKRGERLEEKKIIHTRRSPQKMGRNGGQIGAAGRKGWGKEESFLLDEEREGGGEERGLVEFGT